MAEMITNVFELLRLQGVPELSASRMCVRNLDFEGEHLNENTRVASGADLARLHDRSGFDGRQLFISCYPQVRKAMALHKRSGLLLLAFDANQRWLAHSWVEASPAKTRVSIIGRHERCDLVVPDACDQVSLRHLAVLARRVNRDEVRIEVLDLRSKYGFVDESGRVLRALASEGSLFLRVGGVYVMLLATKTNLTWPECAADAYGYIPERIFLDEVGIEFEQRARHKWIERPFFRYDSTRVTSLAGPVGLAGDLCNDEPPVGRLRLESSRGSALIDVGASSLKRGIVLGRSSRCDAYLVLGSESLSRVHALLTQRGKDILLVDVASTNGVSVDEKPVQHQVVLPKRCNIELAERAAIGWRRL